MPAPHLPIAYPQTRNGALFLTKCLMQFHYMVPAHIWFSNDSLPVGRASSNLEIRPFCKRKGSVPVLPLSRARAPAKEPINAMEFLLVAIFTADSLIPWSISPSVRRTALIPTTA